MKKIGAFILAFTAVLCTRANSIDSLFCHVPQNILPLLESNARLDMLDLYNCGMAARAENIFGGTSQMLAKGHDFVRIRLTDVSEWELKVLPSSPDTILCVVHTLKGVAGDSEVAFYGSNWSKLEMTMPELKMEEFWTATDSLPGEKLQEWHERLSPLAVEAHWAEHENKLEYTLSLAPLNRIEREEVTPYLRSRAYGWVDGRFVSLPD